MCLLYYYIESNGPLPSGVEYCSHDPCAGPLRGTIGGLTRQCRKVRRSLLTWRMSCEVANLRHDDLRPWHRRREIRHWIVKLWTARPISIVLLIGGVCRSSLYDDGTGDTRWSFSTVNTKERCCGGGGDSHPIISTVPTARQQSEASFGEQNGQICDLSCVMSCVVSRVMHVACVMIGWARNRNSKQYTTGTPRTVLVQEI